MTNEYGHLRISLAAVGCNHAPRLKPLSDNLADADRDRGVVSYYIDTPEIGYSIYPPLTDGYPPPAEQT